MIDKIKSALGTTIKKSNEFAKETTFHIAANDVLQVMTKLKKDFGFNYLTDIHSIDHYTDENRFEMVYNLYNLDTKTRLRIKCKIDEENPEVESVVSVWQAANWFEREVYDMMGIRFKNHPDLRRMYMPEDFEYFPLRKEFPLIGIPNSIELPEKEHPKGYR